MFNFEIRPDIICNQLQGHTYEPIREVLAEYYWTYFPDLIRSTQELWEEHLILIGPFRKSAIKSDPKNLDKMASAMIKNEQHAIYRFTNGIDFPVVYHFFRKNPAGIPNYGVYLNHPIKISRRHSPAFGPLFIYMLEHLSDRDIDDFLDYHFENSFSYNQHKYYQFLDRRLMEAPKWERVLDGWKHNNIFSRHTPPEEISSNSKITRLQIANHLFYDAPTQDAATKSLQTAMNNSSFKWKKTGNVGPPEYWRLIRALDKHFELPAPKRTY